MPTPTENLGTFTDIQADVAVYDAAEAAAQRDGWDLTGNGTEVRCASPDLVYVARIAAEGGAPVDFEELVDPFTKLNEWKADGVLLRDEYGNELGEYLVDFEVELVKLERFGTEWAVSFRIDDRRASAEIEVGE